MTMAPGWYPYPQNSGAEAYWDGHQWTGHWRPATSRAKRSGLSAGVWVGIAVIGSFAVVVFVALFHERILVSDDHMRCVQTESDRFAENMFGVEPRGFLLSEIEDKCSAEFGKYIWS
jgi:hypothetical protein